MEALDQVADRLKGQGQRVIEKRLARMENRKFVLFRLLRARRLLRILRELQGK